MPSMALSPSRLSAVLRSISGRIDRSARPSRSAVAAELRRVLAAMGTQRTVYVLSHGGWGGQGYAVDGVVDKAALKAANAKVWDGSIDVIPSRDDVKVVPEGADVPEEGLGEMEFSESDWGGWADVTADAFNAALSAFAAGDQDALVDLIPG